MSIAVAVERPARPVRAHGRAVAGNAGLILLLVAGAVVIALHQDLWRAYITTSDADIVYAYQSLLFNQGLKQGYFDHTGYIYFLLLSGWCRLGHLAGLLPAITLDQIRAAPDFEAAYASLVVAGRLLSMVLAALFALAFYAGTRAITGHRGVAALFAVVFAWSVALVHHTLILRTELPALLFTWLGLVALILAARAAGWRQPAWLAAAGAALMLAMMTKMQVIFLILAFPVLALLFGERPWPHRSRFGGLGGPLLFGLAVAVVVGPTAGRLWEVVWHVRLDGEYFPEVAAVPYQALIVVYVVAMMVLYGAWYRVAPRCTVIALAALALGLGLALYADDIYYDRENDLLLANFIEHMKRFAGHHNRSAAVSLAGMARDVLAGLAEMAHRHFSPGPHPEAPLKWLEWWVLGGSAGLAAGGRWRTALQALALLGMALVTEAAFALRWLLPTYQLFFAPWVLLAAALVTAGLLDRWSGVRPVRAVAGLVVALALVTLVSGIERMWSASAVSRQDPDNACFQARAYMDRLADRFAPYCPPASGPPG